MSTAKGGQAVCDAGLKVQSVDSGLPVIFGREDICYVTGSDEHGIIEDIQNKLNINDKLRLVPGIVIQPVICMTGTSVYVMGPWWTYGQSAQEEKCGEWPRPSILFCLVSIPRLDSVQGLSSMPIRGAIK